MTIKKANDSLSGFIGTENWYKTIVPGVRYTDGVRYLCETYKCYWLVDIICSYQVEKKFQEEEFQVWELIKRKDDSWTLYADDGNGNKLVQQDGDYTDIEFDEVTLWFSHGVIMLPSEY